jgi:hypothetical protein
MKHRCRPRARAEPVIAGHGDFAFLPDLHPRETGTLALARPDGSELRLHRRDDDLWDLLDWREGTTRDGGKQWTGAERGTLAAAEWVACGAALVEVPAVVGLGAP